MSNVSYLLSHRTTNDGNLILSIDWSNATNYLQNRKSLQSKNSGFGPTCLPVFGSWVTGTMRALMCVHFCAYLTLVIRVALAVRQDTIWVLSEGNLAHTPELKGKLKRSVLE